MADVICDMCHSVVRAKTTTLVGRARYATPGVTAQEYIDSCHSQKTRIDWKTVSFLTMYDMRVMRFSIEFGPEDAMAACRHLGSYNEFDGDKVTAFLASFHHAMNDKVELRFEIGREYSPVIYLSCRKWNITFDEFSGAVTHHASLHDIRADEVDVSVTDGGSRLTARLWWD